MYMNANKLVFTYYVMNNCKISLLENSKIHDKKNSTRS